MLAHLRRGAAGGGRGLEGRDALVQIVTTAALVHPEFAFDHVVHDLLKPDPPLGDLQARPLPARRGRPATALRRRAGQA